MSRDGRSGFCSRQILSTYIRVGKATKRQDVGVAMSRDGRYAAFYMKAGANLLFVNITQNCSVQVQSNSIYLA